MIYRKLTTPEIEKLQNQACTACNWETVSVHENFTPDYIHQVNFSGDIRIGYFESDFVFPGGIKRHSGLRNVSLHNCSLGNSVLIENVQNYIANYRIGDNTIIQNLELMYVEGKSSFGNGVQEDVKSASMTN